MCWFMFMEFSVLFLFSEIPIAPPTSSFFSCVKPLMHLKYLASKVYDYIVEQYKKIHIWYVWKHISLWFPS